MADRLDVFLFENGYFESREKAKGAIMAGLIYVNGMKVDKAGYGVKESEKEKIEVRGQTLKYVSRGGLKLEKAISDYSIDLSDKVCVDVGASTGGFTDCMLQNGARLVFSIDVGYGQLDWKLRNDERVVNLERTNVREVTIDSLREASDKLLDDRPSFVSVDVSFISLKKVLPVIKNFVADNCGIVFLIKPQFEAGREKVGKNGVVREKKTHIDVLKSVLDYAFDINIEPISITFSPIKGPKGNIEFLCYGKFKNEDIPSEKRVSQEEINALVNMAHASLTVTD
jgi:23S rRNA (cytidine1920-2'-O)/16S rRNA (cytidine1409-2'-O)-methyltransferase